MTAGKRRASTSKSSQSSSQGWPLWRRRLLKTAKWAGISGLVLALIGAATFIYLYKTIDIPEPNAEFLTETSFVYYDDGETEAGRYATQFRDSIPLSEMPDNLKNAVVAAENKSFWTDNGIDVKGIVRAVLNNASGGSRQGASTITQQYVKILYLSQERSYKRKVKEAILALKVQREYSKEQVLHGYLNTIYFGRGAYGVQAAADVYFDKPAAKLNLRQSAVLAAILNDPNDLDPRNGKAARAELKARFQYVLDQMVSTKDITSQVAEKAKRKLPKFPKQKAESTYGGIKGHILTLVKNQMLTLTNSETGEPFTEAEIDGSGLRITTTLDQGLMADLAEAVEEVRPDVVPRKKLHVGAASVEPGTGALKAFYAGQDYLTSQLNWAVAGGQAGSTFKPYALAAALKSGFSLKDTFDGNNNLEIGSTTFHNAGYASYGRVSLLTATQKSINTAYVDLVTSIPNGPERVIEMANAMGVPPKEPTSPPFGIPTSSPGLNAESGVALGPQTVSPINMANGYATLANQGVAAPVHIVSQVTDKDGRVLYEYKVTDRRAMSADIAADVTYAMQQVVNSGTATGARLSGRPVAGKTGTATRGDGHTSAVWFSGLVPQLATTVMYVRGDGTGELDGWLPSAYGGAYPASTWRAYMTRAMEGVPVEEFPEPAWVDGEAPDDGHAPYTPKPKKTKTSEPTSEPTSEEPTTSEPTSDEPTSVPTSEPTSQEPTSEPPTSEPTSELPCLLCPPTSDPPTSDPTSSTPHAGPSGPPSP